MTLGCPDCRSLISDVHEEGCTWEARNPRVSDWTCGHTAGAVCAECYRLLAERANQLAEENMRLQAALDRRD